MNASGFFIERFGEQLELPKPTISVNRMRDEKNDIEYWGIATMQWDGTWRCYANVQGHLCIVEIKLTLGTKVA